ncbi:DUF3800 domain-containing protein [Parashewanella spongiae]|uniref:DUF3800 domain-containing protein n=1 Tax=Parashewanella spongiae TaxID=342950 RepID=A0A3A6TCJ0_9GAMM|nr:DUF3800 domain-containing protein [Parashewanella spongiae]MCL1080054.1 DUF3800 domain-containing protein [Parashewanella spongiae]RJY05214.1 DUF3800 domain-containing protein [Parashewanella spongiae]
MKFEVYCDENHPELFTSKKPSVDYLMIGSLWLPAELRKELKLKIWQLRETHNVWGEIKWRKVSQSRLEFYKALIDLFISYGEQLRFRSIAINHKQFDGNRCQQDEELGFYKFYYQVLHHWIFDYNQYDIFCDLKVNRELDRWSILKDCLNNANLMASIDSIQALPSRQVVLIQMSDLLLGIASARMNKTLNHGSAKELLVEHLENKLNRKVGATFRGEHKFNIFEINLSGGW